MKKKEILPPQTIEDDLAELEPLLEPEENAETIHTEPNRSTTEKTDSIS